MHHPLGYRGTLSLTIVEKYLLRQRDRSWSSTTVEINHPHDGISKIKVIKCRIYKCNWISLHIFMCTLVHENYRSRILNLLW